MSTIISHTPTWVFVLFFVLIFFGLKQTKPRQINLLQALLLPFLMIILSLAAVITSFEFNSTSLILWLTGGLLSLLLTTRWSLLGEVSYDAQSKHFSLAPSWLPFIAIMLIFFIKYAVAIALARELPFTLDMDFMIIISVIYGLFCGFFAARLICVFLAIKA
ncbi:DUF6622 family protein [Shewanella sp.]|uniref:DUF6622 family protein n=1 Tax=Shewanella sp. TaxID=50422 RepID=UPI004053A344